jgi:hypothetical protein
MPQVEINYLAVLVAGVATMVLGGLWYGPLFGKKWATLMGWDVNNQEFMAQKKKEGKKGYIGGFITALISSWVLAMLLGLTSTTTLAEGLMLGFWIWLGFTATVQLGGVLWESKPMNLFLLNTFYSLVATLIVAAILVSWV